MVVMALMACGSKTVPVPTLDPADWQHVQELARPAGPNGPTDHLERAIEIASRNHWILVLGDKPTIERAKLPEVDLALAELRHWRDANGGVLLLPPSGPRSKVESLPSLAMPLLATDDPEAHRLIGLLGERMLEQVDSILNFGLGLVLVRDVRRHLKQPVDVVTVRRSMVRAIAGEVTLLRRSREYAGEAPPVELMAISAEHAADVDDQIHSSLEILRGISPSSTEADLIDRFRACDQPNENTQRFVQLVATLVEHWRDSYQ